MFIPLEVKIFYIYGFLDVFGYDAVGTASQEGPAGSATDAGDGHVTADGKEPSIEAQEEVLLVCFTGVSADFQSFSQCSGQQTAARIFFVLGDFTVCAGDLLF